MKAALITTENHLNMYQKIASEEENAFAQLHWIQLFKNYHICGIFNDKDEMIGGFSYQLVQLKGFKCLSNLPFTPFIGLFYQIEPELNSAQSSTHTKQVMEAVMNYFKTHLCKNLHLALPIHCTDMQPFCWNRFSVQLKYTYLLDICSDLGTITQNFSNDKRRKIRKAQQDQLEVRSITHFEEIEGLIQNCLKREQLSYLFPDFKAIFDLGSKHIFSFVVIEKGIPTSAIVCFYHKKNCYYLYSCTNKELAHNSASTLCVYAAIMEAKKLGISTFDFEGSMIQGVEAFFRNFGGKLTPYFIVSKATPLIKLFDSILRKNRF